MTHVEGAKQAAKMNLIIFVEGCFLPEKIVDCLGRFHISAGGLNSLCFRME